MREAWRERPIATCPAAALASGTKERSRDGGYDHRAEEVPKSLSAVEDDDDDDDGATAKSARTIRSGMCASSPCGGVGCKGEQGSAVRPGGGKGLHGGEAGVLGQSRAVRSEEEIRTWGRGRTTRAEQRSARSSGKHVSI